MTQLCAIGFLFTFTCLPPIASGGAASLLITGSGTNPRTKQAIVATLIWGFYLFRQMFSKWQLSCTCEEAYLIMQHTRTEAAC